MYKTTLVSTLVILAATLEGCAELDQSNDGQPGAEESVATAAAALVSALGFDDAANGTIIDNRYPGATFSEPLHSGHVYAVKSLAGNGNVVSIHDPNDPAWGSAYAPTFAAEEGAVDVTFTALQQTVSIDALLIEALEALGVTRKPYFQAFNSSGVLLSTVYYPATTSSGWQTLTISRSTAEIKRVRFSSQNNWAGLSGCPTGCPNRAYGGHYGEFDNLRYEDGRGASSGYLGCYKDNPGRALPINLIAMNATVDNCLSVARTKGYAYAGLQAGGQCFAGNQLGFELADPSECKTPCSADPSRYCGGDWRNSMYATGVKPVPGVAGKYVGCYVDSSTRALPVAIYDSSATIESCVAAAQARGLRYAGLQWHGQCFAGNTLQYASGNSGNCYTTCDANPNETCGGSYYNSVYETGVGALPAVAASAYVGCYSDDWSRALPLQLMPNGATVESCVAAARAAGYTYAGLQDGGQCFVGNTLGFSRVADSDCDASVCTANPAEKCGGSFRNRVWLAR